MKIKLMLFIFMFFILLTCSGQTFSLVSTTWKVVDFLRLQDVVSSNFDEATKKLGLRIFYTSNEVHVGDRIFKIKKVVYETIDEKWLWKETAGSSSRPLNFKDFGVTTHSLEVIEYKTEEGRGIGLFLFVIDNNTMISSWNGIYYVLKRQK